MTRALVVAYRARSPRGQPGAGLRVWTNGDVDLGHADGRWQPIATLTPDETAELAELTRAAGVPDLPSDSPAPADSATASDCEWWTDLSGETRHAVIHAWTDRNPAARPSRALVMQLSALVSAAQARNSR